MLKAKKIPVRQCMGCNEHLPKGELIRVVRSPDGVIALDFTGKKNGRGAYLCRKVSCLRKAQKSRRIDKILECGIPDEVYEEMANEIEKGNG